MKAPKRRKPPKLKSIIWRMSPDTYLEYLELGATAYEAEPYSEEYHTALEQLRRLPGYPLEFDLTPGEELVPEVVEPDWVVVH